MVRKSELLLARGAHVDFEQAEWHIPAHSNTGKPHIVFLATQALALFKELQVLAGGSELKTAGRQTWWKREEALNHTLGGVRGGYNRAEYATQRRGMLQFWADYIEQLTKSGQVILARFRQVA